MKKYILFWIWTCGIDVGLAQTTEKLSADFYASRREALRTMLPESSVAVFFAAPIRTRSNDVEYIFHQQRDLLYLTGHLRPESLLLLFKEPYTHHLGRPFKEILFIQTRLPRAELYEGPRPTPQEVQTSLRIDSVAYHTTFSALDLSRYSKILFLPLPDDVPSHSILHNLIENFMLQAQFPPDYTPKLHNVYSKISSPSFLSQNKASIQAELNHILATHSYLQNDKRWKKVLTSRPEALTTHLNLLADSYERLNRDQLSVYMTSLREIKTEEELKCLRQAIRISCVGQNEVMRSIHPQMSEREVQGIHEFVYKKYNIAHEGYPSIVGAGHNGCVLHYIDNSKEKVGDHQLVLMDLGAEYQGYTADITRTIPTHGRFTEAQRKIYDIVLEAQEAALKVCRPGKTFRDINTAAIDAVAHGLLQLNIIEDPQTAHRYLPHGVTHHIGLDVHDRGHYQDLRKNMVITIEPGIYIPAGSPCDEIWWDIAIRIEDNILITQNSYELLSSCSPRRAEDIETYMAQPKSVFYDYKVPELDSIR